MIQSWTRNYIEKWHGISIRENVVRMKLFVKIVTKKKKKKMTRINVGIPPANLSTKHLIAEHRKIKRIPNVVRSGRFSMDGQPKEFKLGTGLIKGFNWGTITLRVATEYDAGENKAELGEYAIEYLKRVSKLFRFYIGVEGSQDEVEFITDLQFHVFPNAFIRINNALGVTSKATDYAPEFGVLFHF